VNVETWLNIINAAISISFALLIMFLIVHARTTYNVYDEGIISYGAVRILHGDVPYRDFWTMYAPAQFYIVAVLYKLFGLKLLVVRILLVAYKSRNCFWWCFGNCAKSLWRGNVSLLPRNQCYGFSFSGVRHFGAPIVFLSLFGAGRSVWGFMFYFG